MKKATTEQRISKKKTALLIAIIVATVAIALLLLYFFSLKPAYEENIINYSEALANYNKVITEYNIKKEQVEDENNKLKLAIDELQKVVSSGKKPYDSAAIPNSNAAINEGKIALVEFPIWENRSVKQPTEYMAFQYFSLKNDIFKIKQYSSDLATIIVKTQIPDYSSVIKVLSDAKDELIHSIKQMEQVTCPSESFVLQRVTNLRNDARMKDIISLTEDNDPENYIGKAGWYTVKVVFHHKDVEHHGLDSGYLTLSEVGNPAGGCIEVYRTEADAQRRADQLKEQEGTSRSPGARMVCGTVVIRVSDHLKASYQKELLEMISAELLRVEE